MMAASTGDGESRASSTSLPGIVTRSSSTRVPPFQMPSKLKAVRVKGRRLAEYVSLPISEAVQVVGGLDLTDRESIIANARFQALQDKLRILFRRPELQFGLAALGFLAAQDLARVDGRQGPVAQRPEQLASNRSLDRFLVVDCDRDIATGYQFRARTQNEDDENEDEPGKHTDA